jgi:hypothetical protein
MLYSQTTPTLLTNTTEETVADVSYSASSTVNPKKITAFRMVIAILLVVVVAAGIYLAFVPAHLQVIVSLIQTHYKEAFTQEVLFFLLVGFAAQAVDGALGMAYGITSTSFLLGLGVPPALASSSVHVSEVFTSGISGLSHLKMGNVDKRLFQRLVLPGAIGAILGAYVLTSIDGDMIKPFTAAYLLIMGIVIIRKAFRKAVEPKEEKTLAPLALFGGFMDSINGGGWGPIVASTLLGKGHNPRYAIGSVNLAEFFIALAGASTFVAMIGAGNWQIILGLVVGGAFAAPFAAFLCKKFKPKTLMIIVGILIIGLSIRTLIMAF